MDGLYLLRNTQAPHGPAVNPPSALRLSVNGQTHHLDVPRDTRLLYVLRNDLALNGPKFGCGLGECGACTVLIDGVAARSCTIPAGLAEGRAIVTLEGLGSVDGAASGAGGVHRGAGGAMRVLP